ncbi:MAG: 4-hydroxythreonine-4-phosphate dehydrogenase PdxA [Pseudomonadota bacterium]
MPSSISNNSAIALTGGDPNGVGLDLTWAAFDALSGEIPFFVIADKDHVAARRPDHRITVINGPTDLDSVAPDTLPVLHLNFPISPSLKGIQYENASAIIETIKAGVDLVQNGAAAALVTNPVHKHVLQEGADFKYPGHTEFLAALAGKERSIMMLACNELRVVPVTIHCALSDVPNLLTQDLLRETIEITVSDLQSRFGIEKPKVAISGLNPHAGESGAFGREEIEIIEPVLVQMKKEGFDLNGPFSADTLFHADARAQYDCAIAMYHDQALIPIKTLDFHGGVNVTLGLPFIRTSPDHGTAFDLAGTSRANPTSLINALKLAHHMATHG